MTKFIAFNDLTTRQKAQARKLRPKWSKEEFPRFQFWVKQDGNLSRKYGHHTLTPGGIYIKHINEHDPVP